ncbi:hypothetical protein [Candidatus Symbiopectobacterium sp. NZEC151]|uniref:hypothetical protein n=1 Tax=Candidatus Symbiopectobacterium sp. NZEC151 TaxID=2820470 RepID=UPI0022279336|nr:hypothetical protein [Candidatus Symbiopectobacterium sp. NZEC151]MCW2475190.1 hypothetical protein [Candidatus Symbiopectobacterium sp. NZEC151]
MPVNIQQYRRGIGRFECRRRDYMTQYTVQKKLNLLSELQSTKLPTKFSCMSMLAMMGVLSSLSRGENSVDEIPQKSVGKYQVNHVDGGVSHQIRFVDKQPYSAYKNRLSQMIYNEFCSSSPVPHGVTEKKQNTLFPMGNLQDSIIDSMNQAVKSLSGFINYYDPLRFPAADAAVPVAVPTTTVVPLGDDVKIKKLNVDCLDKRRALTVSDVLKTIADSFERPFESSTIELQVLSHYLKSGICPSEAEIEKVRKITTEVDKVSSIMSSLVPELTFISFVQRIFSPTIRMISNDIKGDSMSQVDIESIYNEVLGFSKAMVDITIHGNIHPTTIDDVRIPKSLFFENDRVCINQDNKEWLLFRRGNMLYAENEGREHPVGYLQWEEKWRIDEGKEVASEPESSDPFFTNCDRIIKRGITFGKICGKPMERVYDSEGNYYYVENASRDTPRIVPFNEYRFSHAEEEIIKRFDIGLPVTSPLVKQVHFEHYGNIYRVYSDNKLYRNFYNTISIDNRLVPIRAKPIYKHHLDCEIYDLKKTHVSYSVEYTGGRWRFEPSTSSSMSEQLKSAITPAMYDKTVDIHKLSMPGSHGLKFDCQGHAYLKQNGDLIRVLDFESKPYIKNNKGDELHLIYKQHEYSLSHVDAYNKKISLTAEEYLRDKQLNSEVGISNDNIMQLDPHWDLLKTHVRSSSYDIGDFVGSSIYVTFRLRYKKGSSSFHEPPDMQWRELIKCSDGKNVWQFQADMYQHNKNSGTFFSWHLKYSEAYYYSKAVNKDTYNGLVKIYNRNIKPLSPSSLPRALGRDERIENVQNYLKLHGGILDVTIQDNPRIIKRELKYNKERVIKFDLAMNDKSLLTFNQGIFIADGQPSVAFVTTSDNIAIASGEVNAEPPVEVSRQRILKHRK